MKRYFVVVIVLLFSLMACQASGTSTVSKVSISNSEGFGEINTEFFAVFEDEADLSTFQKAITTAEKRDGMVDIEVPEFDIQVIHNDGSTKEYHLWLGEDDGVSTLMKVEDTHTIYTISNELTKELNKLVLQ